MSEKPNNFISETKHWEVYLNPDQYYLGRCVIVAKRDVPEMSLLTKDEWLDFAKLSRKIEVGFKKIFEATMFNWTCLMNNAYKDKNPHPEVHWHLRPRYAKSVSFAGQKFEDVEFGHHYKNGTESPVTSQIEKEIILKIKEILES